MMDGGADSPNGRGRQDAQENRAVVVKLGGSLLDMRDLPGRFSRAVAAFADRPVLVVNGGGAAADAVRSFCATFELDEARGHEWAVEAMRFNARMLAAVLAVEEVSSDPTRAPARGIRLVDASAWLDAAERSGLAVHRRWAFTSDSIAAVLARWLDAERLVLLKSVSARAGETVASFAAREAVDACFVDASSGLERIEVINLRGPELDRTPLRGR